MRLTPALNRDLLRAAAEHCGSLAQSQREGLELRSGRPHKDWNRSWERYARLDRLSRELLEIAND